MKKNGPVLSIILFSACLLAACGTAPAASPTPLPPTILATAILTLTPEPSRTPPPPTRRPSQMAAPTEINAAYETRWAPFSACDDFQPENLSPSENWYICPDYSFFTVTHRNGTSWTFSVEEQLGVDFLGEFGLLHWTTDENFLYFSLYYGRGTDNYDTANANALFRMDLSNGKVATVLGKIDPDAKNIYFVSISPNDRRLAYSIYRTYNGQVVSPIKLHILDLKTGEEKEFPLEPEYYSIVGVTWSDDGHQLAYTLFAAKESGHDINDICDYFYSIKFLDLTNFESTTFIKNEPINTCTDSVIFSVLAVSAERLLLDGNGDTWVYDVASQRLKLQATATPGLPEN